MKIFVTGCSGYIGGTFSYEALKKGHIVYGLDNFVNSTKDKEKITIETNRYAILLKNIKINNKNKNKPVLILLLISDFNYIPPKFLFVL